MSEAFRCCWAADDFPLPTLAGEMERVAGVLENGRGFVLVKRIPVERHSERYSRECRRGLPGTGPAPGCPLFRRTPQVHMLGHAGHRPQHGRSRNARLPDQSKAAIRNHAVLHSRTEFEDFVSLSGSAT
ncbi:hypothetical protein ITI46_01990 [Streptomyces oryzae]|uniref:Uncharacterized protein n=1 Tax=Streptomyces oryzae TaxID=1434886 RepID=A0ABS3X537_9ACTN|nr:hypothetical protein [Streptomyces oryzae]MBO8190489.1 hypothetical protein [Streptomyces oryzae]